MTGIYFNDKHSYKDYGLLLEEMAVGYPGVKQKLIDVPGSGGVMDLSEALTGEPQYEQRPLRFVFSRMADYEEWQRIADRLAGDVHGKKVKIRLDTDQNYYYVGRMLLDLSKPDGTLCQVTAAGEAEPFKYERYDGLSPWLFDDFCFLSGIIREYQDLKVEGRLEVVIPGRAKKTAPVISCSEELTLTYQDKVYALRRGENRMYQIPLGEGEHKLVFTGAGSVSISYRGGVL